jgi:hypothetical protein
MIFEVEAMCTNFALLEQPDVCTAKSAGEFVSQKIIRKVQREFLEVCTISSEALSEVELKGTQEEEEMGHKTAQEMLL